MPLGDNSLYQDMAVCVHLKEEGGPRPPGHRIEEDRKLEANKGILQGVQNLHLDFGGGGGPESAGGRGRDFTSTDGESGALPLLLIESCLFLGHGDHHVERHTSG